VRSVEGPTRAIAASALRSHSVARDLRLSDTPAIERACAWEAIMAEALKDCDIIMKGGITSGVVYPRAILRMSEHYRFRSIGGTSAGAIAAVITAAAEYNRDGDGYRTIERIPEEVQDRLQTLFQPSPPVRTVFDAALLFLAHRKSAAIRKLCLGYGVYFIAGLASGAALAILAAAFGSYLGAALLLLMGAGAGLGLVIVAVGVTTLRDLVALDFGFCPGPTQPNQAHDGLSNWLADKIEIAAGRMGEQGPRPEEPLTFNDLWLGKNKQGDEKKRSIDLRMMTTNLSLRRPNALPHMDANHYFKEEEFARLFPDWIVSYLVETSKANAIERKEEKPDSEDDPPGYHRFPVDGDMPLVVAARMSLSFPILFAAVPLYRRDYPHEKDGTPIMQRMLFSDGGLSSNFPVHFFDALLPNRPTFGISLEALDERDQNRRVHMPMKAGGGIWLDHLQIATLPSFLMSLVNTAKDWQDRLQSTLPGYRERIASVYLRGDEGGLNLTMTSEQIANLVGYGERAGGLMIGTSLSDTDADAFDFPDHRWRRFLVAFARLEESLEQAEKSWNSQTDSTRAFIQAYMTNSKSSYHSPAHWRSDVFARFDQLMTLASRWSASPLREVNEKYIPRPQTIMRITPIS
jgi:predicted acylesterase/phospholipase RssA